MTEDKVNAIWRYVAVTAVGIIIGGTPGYVSLTMDKREAISRVDVDREITVQNAAIVTRLEDLKEQVTDLRGQLFEMQRLEQDKHDGRP